MSKYLRKNLYEVIVLVVSIMVVCMVYLMKGRAGELAWTAAIFVLGPLGILIFLVQLVILIVRCFMKKRARLTPLAASLLLGFPILILMQVIFIPYPNYENQSAAVTLKLPIEGDTVLLGGKEYRTHAVWPFERYAYDIMDNPYDTGNPDLKSYSIYGKNVFASIQGEILEVHDGEEDIEPNVEEFSSWKGNYIYMRIEDTGTYLIYAHLKNNSIRVKEGDVVEIGTILAQVGNSGTTSEPHLHIQHQKNNPCNSVHMFLDEGLPIRFE